MKSISLGTLLLLLSISVLLSQKTVEKNQYSLTLAKICNLCSRLNTTTQIRLHTIAKTTKLMPIERSITCRHSILRQKKVKQKEFQAILDSANVDGSILIFDYYSNTYYSNDFKHCKKGYLPASTFKIANSIIALETGVVEDLGTMFYWDGEPRRLEVWNRDMNLYDAFHASCVPCFQEVARNIGAERMNEYLTKFDYGNMIVDSSNIDKFWLEGDSKITQFEQIDFLKRLYFSELEISESTTRLMKELMLIESDTQGTLSGKTGWAIREGNNTGWFVGYYIKADGDILFVATNIQPNEDFNMDMFPVIRRDISMKAIKMIPDSRFIYFQF
jgi:beta-lactamase class D